MTKYPEFIARFYDVIYNKVRSGVDNEYFLTKACNCRGKILEIGVGTGRLFLDALKRGADIYGIDISPAMINVLYEKLDPNAKHRVWVEDAVEMKIDMKFELILAPFRMFSHITEVDDQLQLLNKIAKHLQPGGQFILDLYVPNLSILLNGFDQFMDFEGEYEEGKLVRRYVTTQSDLSRQTTDVSMKLCWEEKGQEVAETWEFTMRYFFRYEIEHLISRSCLELINIYGDYRENELTKESQDFIVVCTKEINHGEK
jgi:SAM-dependent methyltransferase